MTKVSEIIDTQCGTVSVRKLSLQIIAEMNVMIPSVLVSLDDLNVSADTNVNLYLQPGAKDSLRRVINAQGAKLPITSAYRTVAQQHLLYSWFQQGRCNIGLAARPGKSNHEDGLALDISDPENSTWHDVLISEDWVWQGPNDRFHYSYAGGGRNDIGDIGVKAFQRLWNKYNPSDQITVDGDFRNQTAERMNLSPAEGFLTTRLLRIDSPQLQGDDVRRVQQALVNVSLLQSADVTGIYGEKTADAVGEFQKIRSLSIDKTVGPATRKELGIPN
jgi:Putative peptidoglycan binding domain/D-alanyl-D-alanine carboxypeptidase